MRQPELNDTQLDGILAASSQELIGDSPEMHLALVRLSDAARMEASQLGTITDGPQMPFWKRPVALLLAFGALSIGIVGASQVLLQSNIEFDAIVPVRYVTDTGKQVRCTWAIGIESNNGSDVSALESWVAEHDWEGIGQQAYDFAQANPYVPSDADDIGFTPKLIDEFSLSHALADAVIAELPQALFDTAGTWAGSTSDCLWEMH